MAKKKSAGAKKRASAKKKAARGAGNDTVGEAGGASLQDDDAEAAVVGDVDVNGEKVNGSGAAEVGESLETADLGQAGPGPVEEVIPAAPTQDDLSLETDVGDGSSAVAEQLASQDEGGEELPNDEPVLPEQETTQASAPVEEAPLSVQVEEPCPESHPQSVEGIEHDQVTQSSAEDLFASNDDFVIGASSNGEHLAQEFASHASTPLYEDGQANTGAVPESPAADAVYERLNAPVDENIDETTDEPLPQNQAEIINEEPPQASAVSSTVDDLFASNDDFVIEAPGNGLANTQQFDEPEYIVDSEQQITPEYLQGSVEGSASNEPPQGSENYEDGEVVQPATNESTTSDHVDPYSSQWTTNTEPDSSSPAIGEAGNEIQFPESTASSNLPWEEQNTEDSGLPWEQHNSGETDITQHHQQTNSSKFEKLNFGDDSLLSEDNSTNFNTGTSEAADHSNLFADGDDDFGAIISGSQDKLTSEQRHDNDVDNLTNKFSSLDLELDEDLLEDELLDDVLEENKAPAPQQAMPSQPEPKVEQQVQQQFGQQPHRQTRNPYMPSAPTGSISNAPAQNSQYQKYAQRGGVSSMFQPPQPVHQLDMGKFSSEKQKSDAYDFPLDLMPTKTVHKPRVAAALSTDSQPSYGNSSSPSLNASQGPPSVQNAPNPYAPGALSTAKPPASLKKKQSSFFEELPIPQITAPHRPRASSRLSSSVSSPLLNPVPSGQSPNIAHAPPRVPAQNTVLSGYGNPPVPSAPGVHVGLQSSQNSSNPYAPPPPPQPLPPQQQVNQYAPPIQQSNPGVSKSPVVSKYEPAVMGMGISKPAPPNTGSGFTELPVAHPPPVTRSVPSTGPSRYAPGPSIPTPAVKAPPVGPPQQYLPQHSSAAPPKVLQPPHKVSQSLNYKGNTVTEPSLKTIGTGNTGQGVVSPITRYAPINHRRQASTSAVQYDPILVAQKYQPQQSQQLPSVPQNTPLPQQQKVPLPQQQSAQQVYDPKLQQPHFSASSSTQPHQMRGAAPGYQESFGYSSVAHAQNVAVSSTVDLQRRQFPLFSWSSGGNIAYCIPKSTNYGYGNTVNVVKADVVLKESMLREFPQKKSNANLVKYLDAQITRLTTNRYSVLDDAELLLSQVLRQKFIDPSVPLNLGTVVNFQDIPSSTVPSTINKRHIISLLAAGQKQDALHVALSGHDFALSLLISGLIGKEQWINVVEEYLREEFNGGSEYFLPVLVKILSGDIDSVINTFKADPVLGDWACMNWKEISSAVINNKSSSLVHFFSAFGEFLFQREQEISAFTLFVMGDVPLQAFRPLKSLQLVLYAEIYGQYLQDKGVSSDLSLVLLSHAFYLADYNMLSESQRYADLSLTAFKASKKNSIPFIYAQKRLAQALSGTSVNEGWFAKPKLDKVWGTLDKGLNKLVTGDEPKAENKDNGVFSKFSADLSRSSSIVSLANTSVGNDSAPFGRPELPKTSSYYGYGPVSTELNAHITPRIPVHSNFPHSDPQRVYPQGTGIGARNTPKGSKVTNYSKSASSTAESIGSQNVSRVGSPRRPKYTPDIDDSLSRVSSMGSSNDPVSFKTSPNLQNVLPHGLHSAPPKHSAVSSVNSSNVAHESVTGHYLDTHRGNVPIQQTSGAPNGRRTADIAGHPTAHPVNHIDTHPVGHTSHSSLGPDHVIIPPSHAGHITTSPTDQPPIASTSAPVAPVAPVASVAPVVHDTSTSNATPVSHEVPTDHADVKQAPANVIPQKHASQGSYAPVAQQTEVSHPHQADTEETSFATESTLQPRDNIVGNSETLGKESNVMTVPSVESEVPKMEDDYTQNSVIESMNADLVSETQSDIGSVTASPYKAPQFGTSVEDISARMNNKTFEPGSSNVSLEDHVGGSTQPSHVSLDRYSQSHPIDSPYAPSRSPYANNDQKAPVKKKNNRFIPKSISSTASKEEPLASVSGDLDLYSISGIQYVPPTTVAESDDKRNAGTTVSPSPVESNSPDSVQGDVSTSDVRRDFAPPAERRATYSPTKERSSTYVSVEESRIVSAPTADRRSSYIPVEERRTSYAPVEERKSSYVPVEERRSSYVPVDERRTSYVPQQESRNPSSPAQSRHESVSDTSFHAQRGGSFSNAMGQSLNMRPISPHTAVPPSKFAPRQDSTAGSGVSYEPPSARMTAYEPPKKEQIEQIPEEEYYDDIVEDEDDDDDDDEDDDKNAKNHTKSNDNVDRKPSVKKNKESKGSSGGSGWLGGWFRKDSNEPKVYKANLGEKSNFHYDENLKRWVNGDEDLDELKKKAAPPPPPIIKKKPSSILSKPRPSIVEGSIGQPSRHPSDNNTAVAMSSDSSERVVSTGSSGAPQSLPPPPSSSLTHKAGPPPPSDLDSLMSMTSGPSTRRKKKPGRGYVDVMGTMNMKK